jgi:hypothetical protein
VRYSACTYVTIPERALFVIFVFRLTLSFAVSPGAIAGIVIGFIVFCVIAVILAILVLRQGKSERTQDSGLSPETGSKKVPPLAQQGEGGGVASAAVMPASAPPSASGTAGDLVDDPRSSAAP